MLPERPPAERIQYILDHRLSNADHLWEDEAQQDYLQLCAEIDHLRAEIEGLKSGCSTNESLVVNVLDEKKFFVKLAGEIRVCFPASNLSSPKAVLEAVRGTQFEEYFDPSFPGIVTGILDALFPVEKEK